MTSPLSKGVSQRKIGQKVNIEKNSLLRSRSYGRHATLLPTNKGGALRDDPKNGCVGDYEKNGVVNFISLVCHLFLTSTSCGPGFRIGTDTVSTASL